MKLQRQTLLKTCIPALLVGMILLFQNCSTQFQFADAVSQGVDPESILSAPPEITFLGNVDIVNTAVVTIAFEVQFAAGSSLKSLTCQLNSGAAQDCLAKTVSFNNLADGDYTLKVVAENNQGTKTEAMKVFRKDATAPVVTVSMAPPTISNNVTASFSFIATDVLSGVMNTQCSLDNTPFTECTSPVNLTGLASGTHNYRIRATDRAGNMSVLYSHSWMVDLTAPTVNITSMPPAVTNRVTASFSFSGTGIVSYECQLDSGAYAACTSPLTFNNLTAASHTFRVRGTNSAGNVSAVTAYPWVVDNVAPSTPTLTSNVTTTTIARGATFTFVSVDVGSGVASYQCSLDNAAFVNCASPQTLANLALGDHTFRVKARDNASNESAVASYAWTITPTLASVSLGWDPNTEAALAGYKIYYGTSSNNQTSSIDIGMRTAVDGVVTYTIPNLSVGTTYYFSVVAYDAAKIESPKSNEISKLVQ